MENQSRKERTSHQEKSPKTPKKHLGIWKWLFLILLAINIAGAAFIAVRVLTPRDQTTLNQAQASVSTDQKVGQLTTTSDGLNQVINSYLQDYQSSTMSYKFYISGQQAVLEASYELFGSKIPLYVYFQPLALSDGSVSLSVQSVSAGTLSLPTATVLNMIKGYDLPKFVQVDSSKSQIILKLPQISLGNGLYVKANQIDLTNGNFTFDFMKKA